MASQGYETVDLNKKKLIEEDLVEERDDAIIRVAKMRKRQPPKLRSKARNIASNIIQYYSRVCVKGETSAELLKLSGFVTENDFLEFGNTDAFHNLNNLSKTVMDCLSQRKELMKVRCQHLESLAGSKSKCRIKRRHRLPQIASPHMYSTDFIVDENLV